jgi:uncharacterized membrane protein
MDYLLIKWLHILSSTILFGTGIGSAFYKWIADRNGNMEHIAKTNRSVVLADWLFTTPTVILQPVTGFVLVYIAGYDLTALWLQVSIALYLLAGLCWLPVVVLQIRMRDMSERSAELKTRLPVKYWAFCRWWILLGVVAFISLALVFYLMVVRPF